MRKITFGLSAKEILRAKDEINNYKQKLIDGCDQFVNELADLGIKTALMACENDELSKYIAFTKEAVVGGEKTLLLVATNRNGLLKRFWFGLNEYGVRVVKSADISPLLMVEFGSGMYAENPYKFEGVGRGTFPGQTHAFEDSWSYQTLDGVWHESSGIKPSMPMYKAWEQMYSDIYLVAQKVFGGI